MRRVWQCLKRIWAIYTRVMVTLSIVIWVIVWIVGSYRAGQLLSPDDVITTADRWIGKR